jgi:hypothetical protein
MFIPAGAADHREDAVYLFARLLITSLLPHMHNRGKSMKYTLMRPDGSESCSTCEVRLQLAEIYRLREPCRRPGARRESKRLEQLRQQPRQPQPEIDVPGATAPTTDAGRLHRLHRRDERGRVRRRSDRRSSACRSARRRESFLVNVEGRLRPAVRAGGAPRRGEPGKLYMVLGN